MKHKRLLCCLLSLCILCSVLALSISAAPEDNSGETASSEEASSQDEDSSGDEDAPPPDDASSEDDGPGYPDDEWWLDEGEKTDDVPAMDTVPYEAQTNGEESSVSSEATWNEALSPTQTEGQVLIGEIYLAESTFKKNPVLAHVTAVMEDAALADSLFNGRSPESIVFEAVLDSGEFAGTTVSAIQSLDASTAAFSRPVSAGDKIYLSLYRDSAYAVRGVFSDYSRSNALIIVGLIAAALVILCCRGRGARALLVLILSGALMLFGALPLLNKGFAPGLVLGSAAVLLLVLATPILYGFRYRTLTALAGALVSLALAGGMAFWGQRLLGLSGISDISFLRAYYTKDLTFGAHATLIAGVLMAALGALTVVSNTVSAGAESRPGEAVDARSMFLLGCRRGAAALTPIVLTLGFFCIGTTMSNVALLSAGGADFGRVFSDEFITGELVRFGAVVLSLLMCVPLTSLFSVLLLPMRKNADGSLREMTLKEKMRQHEEALFGKISDKLDAAVLSAAGETEKAEEAIEEAQTEIDEALEEEISQDKAALAAMEAVRAKQEHPPARRNKPRRKPKAGAKKDAAPESPPPQTGSSTIDIDADAQEQAPVQDEKNSDSFE